MRSIVRFATLIGVGLSLAAGPLAPLTALADNSASALVAPAAVASVAQPSAAASFSDGDLLQISGGDKMFLIQDGKRRWIADTVSLKRLNPDFARLHQVDFATLDAIPAGRPYRELPVIRDDASGRIYLLTRQTGEPGPSKHWINDLDSFTKLGFEWNDVDTHAGYDPAKIPDAPTLTYKPVSHDQTTWQYQDTTLQIVPAWRLQVEDDELYAALALADTYNSQWREMVAPKLLPHGPWIAWADLPQDVGGRYNLNLNRVEVANAIKSQGVGVVASVLSHEVFHAVTDHDRSSKSCYDEEITATGIGAVTWENLPAKWHTQNDWGSSLDLLVKAWHSGIVERAIRQDPAYQHECGVR